MPDVAIPGLLDGGWREAAFTRFRDGIDVHWLRKGTDDEPSLAILRYAPGARVPRHRHVGMETIMVLDGVQSDESGDYAKGAVILNAVDSEHSVWSDEGCVVLIQWNRPVLMLE